MYILVCTIIYMYMYIAHLVVILYLYMYRDTHFTIRFNQHNIIIYTYIYM